MCGSHLIWITYYGEENIEVRRGNEEYLQKKKGGVTKIIGKEICFLSQFIQFPLQETDPNTDALIYWNVVRIRPYQGFSEKCQYLRV